MSVFQKIIKYVNTNNIGDVINRPNMLRVSKESSDAYIDTIRLKLTGTGFLKCTQVAGRYKLAKKIPTTISSSDLDRAYYLIKHRLPYSIVVGKILNKFITKITPTEDADPNTLKNFNEIKEYVNHMIDSRNVYEVVYAIKTKDSPLVRRLVDEIVKYDKFLIKNKKKSR